MNKFYTKEFTGWTFWEKADEWLNGFGGNIDIVGYTYHGGRLVITVKRWEII